MKELALCAAVIIGIAVLASIYGCASAPLPAAPPEPGFRSRVIEHKPTRAVPWKWSEERFVEKSAHDDLVAADGSIVPGVPREEVSVELNGVALK